MICEMGRDSIRHTLLPRRHKAVLYPRTMSNKEATYGGVCMVQEVFQGVIRLGERLAENSRQSRHGSVVVSCMCRDLPQ